jgi:nucleotide-binding universal stress UspA family protein
MSSILACTDGSIYAKSVYQHAAWASQQLNLPVHLLNMIERQERNLPSDLSGNLSFEPETELLEELTKLDETQAKLSRLKSNAILENANAAMQNSGILEMQILQRHGSIVDAIEEFQPTEQGLIVIGKRGEHANFAKGHLGSNLERVIRSASVPILVSARAFTPIERFTCAFDGSKSSAKAIEFLVSSPLFQGAECQLLAVTQANSELTVALESAQIKLEAAGYRVITHVQSGKVNEIITEQVKVNHSQVLMMGAYGHSKIRHLIIGSTTSELIRTCQNSVFVIR